MIRTEPSRGDERPEFSVVLSCFNEAETVELFHARLTSTLEKLGRTYEIIFVNDGSRDDTWNRVESIYRRDPHVAAVRDLVRNSGTPAAVTAGIEVARGRTFIFIDSDLQLDPEELPLLVEAWDRGADIVNGYRVNRTDSWARQVASFCWNGVMRHLGGVPLRDIGCTFRIIDGCVIRAFGFGPRQTIRMTSLLSVAGHCEEVPVRHCRRPHGRTGWRLASLVRLCVDLLLEISSARAQILGGLAAATVVLAVFRLLTNLAMPESEIPSVAGQLIWDALLLTVLFFGMLVFGIREYAHRTYLKALGTPEYIVRREWIRQREAGECSN